MASWLKDTFMDFFMGSEWSESPPAPQSKRKAGGDGRGRARAKRHSDEAYRNAPYGTPGPSRPRRQRHKQPKESLEVIRARRSLEDLARHLPSDPNPVVQNALERLQSHLGVDAEPHKPIGKLTLTGRPQSLEELTSSIGSDVASPEEEVDATWEPMEYVQPALEQPRYVQTPNERANIPRKTKPANTTKPSASSQSVPPTDEPWKRGITTDEMWATRPNKRAREILKERPLRAKQFIQAEVQEPEYALRDVEIRDGLWHMMDLMERLTKKFFVGNTSLRNRETSLRECFKQLTPETAKIIGCSASGGPGGSRGWENLFLHDLSRRALVMAIIGNVLVEQVFQHIFFGGIVKHIAQLTQLQEKHRNADGEFPQ